MGILARVRLPDTGRCSQALCKRGEAVEAGCVALGLQPNGLFSADDAPLVGNYLSTPPPLLAFRSPSLLGNGGRGINPLAKDYSSTLELVRKYQTANGENRPTVAALSLSSRSST